MKITIQIDENCIEDEVIIRCKELNDITAKIQRAVTEATIKESKMELLKGGKSFYIPVDDILFFESDGDVICAHTSSEIFITKCRLYELEKLLPWYFSRISKSAILNTQKIYSITRNITSTSIVEFKGTNKQVYVSRAFLKPLMSKLEEMRNH